MAVCLPSRREMLNAADTCSKQIDPAIHAGGWKEDFIKREKTWGALYANESIPFEKLTTKGEIAVKVINHYGDEVLKVYEV